MSSTDRDKHHDKRSGANPTKHIPKDAQVIMSIMKELGIREYEPRVINQLLEFTYRYVTCILDDAKVYTNHAKKKIVDLDDVKLASQMVLDKSFTNPPPRDILLEIARGRNIAPLPAIKTHCGLRLPPDRYCLIATNYKLKAAAPPKKLTKSALTDGRSTIKTTLKSGGAGGGGAAVPGAGGAKRQNVGGAKQQTVSIPKPVFKFSSLPKAAPPKPKVTTSTGVSGGGGNGIAADGSIKMEMHDDDGPSGQAAVKRKREEDDFQIVG